MHVLQSQLSSIGRKSFLYWGWFNFNCPSRTKATPNLWMEKIVRKLIFKELEKNVQNFNLEWKLSVLPLFVLGIHSQTYQFQAQHKRLNRQRNRHPSGILVYLQAVDQCICWRCDRNHLCIHHHLNHRPHTLERFFSAALQHISLANFRRGRLEQSGKYFAHHYACRLQCNDPANDKFCDSKKIIFRFNGIQFRFKFPFRTNNVRILIRNCALMLI